MKLRFELVIDDKLFQGVIEDETAALVVRQVKLRVGKKVGGWKGFAIRRASDSKFMIESVKAYDKKFGTVSDTPRSAEQFLDWAKLNKIVEAIK